MFPGENQPEALHHRSVVLGKVFKYWIRKALREKRRKFISSFLKNTRVQKQPGPDRQIALLVFRCFTQQFRFIVLGSVAFEFPRS